jgi:hypothetical protein
MLSLQLSAKDTTARFGTKPERAVDVFVEGRRVGRLILSLFQS